MRAVYISANAADQTRANTLGLGLIVTSGTATPFAFLQGAGLAFTLPEPINTATLQADMTTIQNAEASINATALAAAANADTLRSRAQTALTNNATFLALANPTQTQAVAQVQALTRQTNGLIRFLLGAFDTIADS